MRPRRARRSARSVATARIAITSDDTEIWNPLCIISPSILPPRPMMISRSAWALKSMAQPMATLRESMLRRCSFLRARVLSP